jgi:hypothetical protein
MMKAIVAKSLFLLLMMGGVVCGLFNPAQAVAQTAGKEIKGTWTWERTDDDWKMRVRIEGKAEFADDYRDFKNVSEGGRVTVEERRGSTRRMEITRGASGELQHAYYLNGVARPFDAEARAWLAGMLLLAVRQNAIDAGRRLRVILRERGLNGVLTEIASVSSDYIERLYYEAFLKGGMLDADSLQVVLRDMASRISSDYEKAQLLIATAEPLMEKDGALSALFHAIQTISSDYERRRVLSVFVKKSNLRAPVLSGILKAAETMSSDYEKATFLVEASDAYSRDARLRDAYLKIVDTIRSDHERSRVQSALLRKIRTGSTPN